MVSRFPSQLRLYFNWRFLEGFETPGDAPKKVICMPWRPLIFFQSVSETLTICQFRTHETLKNTQSCLPSAPASPMFSWERLLCCSCNSILFHLFCFRAFVLKGAQLTWTSNGWGRIYSESVCQTLSPAVTQACQAIAWFQYSFHQLV